jgi:tetratricopeptide (TPR) repeat protein
MKTALAVFLLARTLSAWNALELARDRQDRAALESMVADLGKRADQAPADPNVQYRFALAASYLAEVGLELREKDLAQKIAEQGIRAAERAVALRPANGDYHRVLGVLCGQVIPANIFSGFTYGKRARDAISKALELDPKSSKAYLARGIGYYYLPTALGGGTDRAIADFRKAIELDVRSADAHLWLGLALRKAKQNTGARKALEKSLELNPGRVWTKVQLEKTPPQ